MHFSGWFQLINTTTFSVLASGGFSSTPLTLGEFVNTTHFVLSSLDGRIFMVNNSRTILWQQKQPALAQGIHISCINSLVYWMTADTSQMVVGAVSINGATQVF